MKPKSNKASRQNTIIETLKKRLLQEVIVIDIKNQDGKYSHSEVSYLCLN